MSEFDFDKMTVEPLVFEPVLEAKEDNPVQQPKLDHHIVVAGSPKPDSLNANPIKSTNPSPLPVMIKLSDLESDRVASTTSKPARLDKENGSNSPLGTASTTTKSPTTFRLLLKKADDFLDQNLGKIKKIFQ